MQYLVPQNVDIEDRVVGPFTLRQFLMLVVAGGIIMVLFYSMTGPLRVVFWLLTILVGAGTIGVAFGNYGGVPIEKIIISAFALYSRPQKRIWKKIDVEIKKTITKSKEETTPEQAKKIKTPEEAINDLDNLARIIDTGGSTNTGGRDIVQAPTTFTTSGESVVDVFSAREDRGLSSIIDKMAKKTKKSEPLLSELAKVSPKKEFDYDKIETKSEDFI